MRCFTRTSWILAGLVLIAGAIMLALNTYAYAFGDSARPASHVIGWTWSAAAAAFVLGCVIRDRDDRDSVAAAVLPSVGIALVLPLTIHLVIATLLYPTRSFDEWVQYSLLLVSVAHLVFAVLVGLRAAAIAQQRPPISVGTIYYATVCTAGVPGLVLVLPLVLVALTGLPILPLLHGMKRWCAPRHHLPFAIARAG